MSQNRSQLLLEFLQTTKQMHDVISKMDNNMEKNDPVLLDHLNDLMDDRSDSMKKWEQLKQEDTSRLNPTELKVLQALKQLENDIQPRLEHLFHSYSQQMKKFQQGKQSAQKYQNSYEESSTNSSFIDKRK